MLNLNFVKYLIGGVSMILIIQLWINYNFDFYDILIIMLLTMLIMQLTDLIELKLSNQLKMVQARKQIAIQPKLIKSDTIKINNPPKLVKSNLIKINNHQSLLNKNKNKNKNKKVTFNNQVKILTSDGKVKIVPLAN